MDEPPPPIPLPPPPNPPGPTGNPERRAYLRGLAFGGIPLAIFWTLGGIAGYAQYINSPGPYSYAGATPLFAGVLLGGAALVFLLLATIVCLARRQTRFLGYGLLTMLLVSPVLAVLGCQVYIGVLSNIHSSP